MAKKLVMLLGIVFIVVGLLGFVNNPILGLFEVDALHNIIHLVSGALALLAVSKGAEILFARIFGIVYGVVAVLGLLMDGDVLGLIHVNGPDNVLHVLLAVIFLVIGFGMKKNDNVAPTV